MSFLEKIPLDQITEDQARKEAETIRPQLIKWGKEYYEQDVPFGACSLFL